MNTESLKHHLATVVMRLELVLDDEPYPFDTGPIYRGENSTIFVSEFDPPNNIVQALDCAKAIPDTTFVVESCVAVWSDEKLFRAAIRSTKRIQTLAVSGGDSESEALSLASAEATGWKE